MSASRPTDPSALMPLTVLHAGALTSLVGRGLGPAFEREAGIPVLAERGHSVALADGIKDGSRVGDLFMSADAAVNESLIGAANGDHLRWFVAFARNAVVLAYSPVGPRRADFERVKTGVLPWYEALGQPGLRLRRNDPDDDPMGYYTVLVCQLAEEYHAQLGLQRRVLGEPRNPEQLAQADPGGLANGTIDAMFLYRSAALGAGLPFLDLPDAINLGNPDFAETYARASHTTADGRVFRGRPIRFSAAPLTRATQPEAAERFLAFLLGPAGRELTATHHFSPGPVLVGGDRAAVPGALRSQIEGEYNG